MFCNRVVCQRISGFGIIQIRKYIAPLLWTAVSFIWPRFCSTIYWSIWDRIWQMAVFLFGQILPSVALQTPEVSLQLGWPGLKTFTSGEWWSQLRDSRRVATYLDICMILSLLLFTTVVFVSSDKYIQMLVVLHKQLVKANQLPACLSNFLSTFWCDHGGIFLSILHSWYWYFCDSISTSWVHFTVERDWGCSVF